MGTLLKSKTMSVNILWSRIVKGSLEDLKIVSRAFIFGSCFEQNSYITVQMNVKYMKYHIHERRMKALPNDGPS